MAAAAEAQDKVIVVAVVQWEIQGSDGVAKTTTSRIRIRKSDLSNDEHSTVCKVRDLLNLIIDELQKEIPETSMNQDEAEVQVDVYDDSQDTYVSLQDNGILEQDVTERFGSRLKVNVRLIDKRRQAMPHFKAIMGRFYSYDASEGLTIAGKTLLVNEVSNRQNGGTGVNLWDGALLLAQYLEQQPNLVQSKRVLELGSGIGLVGIAAGVLGAREVLLTDLPYTLENMKANVKRHSGLLQTSGCEKMVCGACDWYDPPSLKDLGAIMDTSSIGSSTRNENDNPTKDEAEIWEPDIILIADCVWVQELVAPLLATVKHFTNNVQQSSKRPDVLISYQRRGKGTHEEFWAGLHNDFDATVKDIDVTTVDLSKPDSIHLLSMDFNGA